jgi:spore maturation protein A
MLNYIWAGLIVAAFGFAMSTDLTEALTDHYANGRPLPIRLILPDDVDLSRGSIDTAVRLDEAEYRGHFGIEAGEPLTLPAAVAATLSRPAEGGGVYELKITEVAGLPPRLRAIAAAADRDDPFLIGTVAADAVGPGESAVSLAGLPEVRFRKLQDITAAAFFWAEFSVLELALPLLGVLALWLGVVKIAEHGGLVDVFVKAIRPVLGRLFPELPKDHPALGMIGLNLAANMLGLGNAATPMGIKAMQEMQKLNPEKDTATNSMCMFLAMNTASVMLVPPATLVGIMGVATGQLWAPIVIVTFLSLAIAIVACRSLQALPLFRRTDPMPRATHASPEAAPEVAPEAAAVFDEKGDA